METTPTLEVRPIYGWGWVITGQPRFEPPAIFSIGVDGSEASQCSGLVLTLGHEFYGQRAVLSQRHAGWDGNVNILVEGEDGTAQHSSGFGLIESFPANMKR